MSSAEDGARYLAEMLKATGYHSSDFIDDALGTPKPGPCDAPMPAALVRCSLAPGHAGHHVANGVSGAFIAEWRA